MTATSVSYGKNGNFDPCKIETFEQVDTRFVKIDYVHEGTYQIW